MNLYNLHKHPVVKRGKTTKNIVPIPVMVPVIIRRTVDIPLVVLTDTIPDTPAVGTIWIDTSGS
jgi:hypothetical protein